GFSIPVPGNNLPIALHRNPLRPVALFLHIRFQGNRPLKRLLLSVYPNHLCLLLQSFCFCPRTVEFPCAYGLYTKKESTKKRARCGAPLHELSFTLNSALFDFSLRL